QAHGCAAAARRGPGSRGLHAMARMIRIRPTKTENPDEDDTRPVRPAQCTREAAAAGARSVRSEAVGNPDPAHAGTARSPARPGPAPARGRHRAGTLEGFGHDRAYVAQ